MRGNMQRKCRVIVISVPLDKSVTKIRREESDNYIPWALGLQHIKKVKEYEITPIAAGSVGAAIRTKIWHKGVESY